MVWKKMFNIYIKNIGEDRKTKRFYYVLGIEKKFKCVKNMHTTCSDFGCMTCTFTL